MHRQRSPVTAPTHKSKPQHIARDERDEAFADRDVEPGELEVACKVSAVLHRRYAPNTANICKSSTAMESWQKRKKSGIWGRQRAHASSGAYLDCIEHPLVGHHHLRGQRVHRARLRTTMAATR